AFTQMMVDPTLAEMGKNLNEAMKMLEDSQREAEDDKEKKKYIRRDIPGPLQGSGQDMSSILQLVQNLMHGEEEEESQSPRRIQNVGEQGHMALLGHSLAAYISVLDRERLRKLTTRILSDTTLWLCRLFRFVLGYFVKEKKSSVQSRRCSLAVEDQCKGTHSDSFTCIYSKISITSINLHSDVGSMESCCSVLGLPLSCMCSVPCNTMFGSQHQMDVALLDRLIKEDIDSGKHPLLLVANAVGTPGAGHTDKLGRLKELCSQYNMWLHVEGKNVMMPVVIYFHNRVLAATKCDSMTLTLGPWLGLPAVPAVTLYRHEDPSLSLAAGLTSSQPVEKLRALPLWLSLQYLGHDGIVERIKHASQLSQRLLEHLKKLNSIKTSVEDELSSPVVVFRFTPEHLQLGPDQSSFAAQLTTNQEATNSNQRDIFDAFNRWLGEQLAQLVPASGVDIVELEDEGTCVRFSPLMTSAVLGTKPEDVDQLVECLKGKIPVLTSTLQFREEFKQEVYRTAGLTYIEDLSWPGVGVIRYELNSEEQDDSKRQADLEKITAGLLRKLKEMDSDLSFSTGPEFGGEKNCIYIGMVTEDLDVPELVEAVAATGREIEESSKLLENMTEVVRRGILEAELQLQKANEEKLMQEGVLRQIPLVGSMLNWLSPVQTSLKGRSFNLAAGSLESTETTYVSKAQDSGTTPPPTPSSTHAKQKLPGHKLFRRSSRNLDALSETSSVSHAEESEKEDNQTPLFPTVPEKVVATEPEASEQIQENPDTLNQEQKEEGVVKDTQEEQPKEVEENVAVEQDSQSLR
uniref:Pyridoxal-dependent decarboxylase domain-containing protein 1 n=1 Tax=Latimeria chalumnae TaxID=7897 RepID=H3AXD1_LATCH